VSAQLKANIMVMKWDISLYIQWGMTKVDETKSNPCD